MRPYLYLTYIIVTLSICAPSIGHAVTASSNSTSQRNIITIKKRDNIKVVYDVKNDDWEAGVGKALYYVRGLLESYKSMGVSPDKLHISVVMHGPTAYWLLNDAAYQKRSDDPFDYNSNGTIVQELLTHGVSVEICNSSMKANGWTEKDLLPGVTIVHDAYTRFIDLQLRGYAYIRF
jgi:intracellular sulfur oxidation DsrE/DsrF family protein